ncbi:MAG: DNA modification methylase [Planctomycetes bacterium]|nr:DNA modification methylase [Planctomycetota bacterium]
MKKPKKPPTTARVWHGAPQLEQALVAVSELKLDPANPRRHGDRNLEAIRASLFQFGQLRPIVVQRSTMQVVAGNGTMRAAQMLGWTHVAATVTAMSDAEARAFSVADNRTAELAEWDPDQLAAALSDPSLDDLLGATGFTQAEIDKLLGDDASGLPPQRPENIRENIPRSTPDDDEQDEDEGTTEPANGEADDPIPELPKEPKTKAGDVWVCGDHEVLCADSFGDVAAAFIGRARFDAVVTDPPYAIFGSSTGVASDIADDKMVRPFFAQLGRLMAAALKLFGHAYVCTDWRSWAALWESLKGTNIRVRNMLVWNKRGSGLGSNYANTHELIAFAAHLPEQKAMTSRQQAGVRPVHKGNVLEFNRPTGDDRPHNASKPVGLIQQLIENSTDKGGLVLEPFGGGGSTLVACEKAGRRCRLIEIEPKWCDVIVARWEQLTGRKAERREGQRC